MTKAFNIVALVFSLMLYAGIASAQQAIDINSASAKEIAAAMKGVGEKRAQQIIEYRKANGPYQSIDDLINIKGIGKKTIQANREKIMVKEVNKQ